MVTASDVQQLIIDEVGDTPSGLLEARIVLLWESYADKAATHPRLQELYTKRRAIDIVLGSLRNQVTFSLDGAVMVRLGDRVKYLETRREETLKEIIRWETIARANRPGVQAPITQVFVEPAPLPGTPSTPNPSIPDANDERYRGSPYYSTNTSRG